jgi:putative DNA primase/helicase
MRAYHMTGLHSSVPALGSFEEWSHRVRDPLIWLGLPDPCITIEKARRSDPKLSALTAVVGQWWLAAGSEKLLVKKLVETAAKRPDLNVALTAVAGDGYGAINNDRLGKWLNRNKGRVVGIGDGLDRRGAKITDCGILHGNSLWQVVMETA